MSKILVFSTPIYYYGLSGQMKTLLDRMNPLFAGTLFCGGLNDAGEAAENSDIQEKAYQFGKAVI